MANDNGTDRISSGAQPESEQREVSGGDGRVGKGTLTESLQRRVQLREAEPGAGAQVASEQIQDTAAQGVSGAGGALPHLGRIQTAFGKHDVSGVQAHVGGPAADASRAMGAEAYATGNRVAFGSAPDLHTAAHEAAHVVQQQGGVQLLGGVGEVGDSYEQHADAVADKVVAGESAEALLDQHASGPPALQRKAVQFRKGDYKKLWTKDPTLAKLSITQTTGFQAYEAEARRFEQKLGAGLFAHPASMEGANALITAIATLLGDTANATFGAAPEAGEAGAIPSDKVQEARDSGNLREKMYMVYTAIRTGAIAKKLNEEQGLDVPKDKQGRDDTRVLNERHLARRGSTASQERGNNWGNLTDEDRMPEEELTTKGAPLSPREQTLSGGTAPKFVPGEKGYTIAPKKRLSDTSKPKGQDRVTYGNYQRERLAPLAAGLSGSTDWYFNVANQLGLDPANKQKLRLAALGQMLTNRDHSYHEIMHEARTQGKLGDYPDELPIGYTTLAPLSEADILAAAGGAVEFPGDAEATRYNAADAKGVAPTGLAETHGLPTATGMRLLAGDPSRRFKIFGGGEKGKKYLAILAALDNYSTDAPQAKKHLQTISTKTAAWLRSHAGAKPDSLQGKRVAVMEWLQVKVDAMLEDQPGPPPPPWIDAKYYDTAEQAIEAITAEIGAEVPPEGVSEAERVKLFKKALTKVEALVARQDLPGLSEYQAMLAREVNRTDNVLSGGFVASTSDLSLDMNIRIATKDLPTPNELMGKDWLAEVQKNVIENVKLIKEARTRVGGPAPDNSDLVGAPQEAPNPMLARMPAKMRATAEEKAKAETKGEVDRNYSSHIEDFQSNIDTSMVANVQPGTPIDDFLRRLKGEPLPPELAAIAAYAEDGFYQNMNYVLNHSHDKKLMAKVPEDLLKLCRLAASGLRKMKPYTGGSVYRGIPGESAEEIEKLVKTPVGERQAKWQSYAGNWTQNQFLSTSKRWESSYAVKAGKFVAIEIQGVKTGVDISAISNTLNEREVLFPPRAKLTTVSVTDRFLSKDRAGTVKPGTEANKMDVPYNDPKEPGRIHVVLTEG